MTEIREFIVDPTGGKCWGIVIRPDVAGVYSTIVFLPGDGQKGDGTKATVDQLYANGSPLAQARDGKLPGRIVIALQGVKGQGLQPEQLGYALKNDIFPKYRTSYLMVTGLSLGGQCTLEFAGSPLYGELPVFCLAMSAPTIRNEVVDWKGMEAMVLLIHGDLDATGQTDYHNSVRVNTDINSARPGYSAMVLVKGKGHDSSLWAPYYTPGTAITIGGKTFKDIYDLFDYISVTEGYLFPAPTGTGGAGGVVTGNSATAKLATPVIVGGKATFDATGSAGYTSWNFQFNNPATGTYIKVGSWSGATNGDNRPIVLPVVSGIPNGTYEAELRLQPGNAIAKQAVVIGSSNPLPDPPTTRIALVTVYDGKKSVTLFKNTVTGAYTAEEIGGI